MGKNPKKPKRKPSAYNKHIGREMRAGKTMKQAAASWKRKSSKKSSPKKTTSKNKSTGGRKVGKNGFNLNKIYKLIRYGALAMPAAVSVLSGAPPVEIAKQIAHKYTGVNPNDGTFRLSKLREGWEPFFWANVATHGIPKVISFIKGLI